MKNLLNNPPTTISNPKSVKFYVAEGGKYATPSNWKLMGLSVKSGAIATLYTTKTNGYEITLYNESQTVPYDAMAEAKAKAAEKEIVAKENDILKAYRAHEITVAQFTIAMAELRA